MGSDKKKWREASRWLRVTAFSLSALGPFINILLARLRAYTEAEKAIVQLKREELEGVARSVQHDINLDWQERLQIIGAALNDLLREMREQPYGQKLLQQGEALKERSSKLSQAVAERGGQLTQGLAERSGQLTQDFAVRGSQLTQGLTERGGQLTQGLAERSSQLTQDFAERGNQLTQDLAERGSQLTHELADRSGELSQELVKRSRKASRELAEQDRSFWIVFGFTCGLVATGIVTFVLMRRRMQKSRDEEPPIQLYSNSIQHNTTSQPRGNIYSVGANGTKLEAQTVATAEPEKNGRIILANRIVPASAPAGAAFIGISSTKEYYPIDAPLDQIRVSNGKEVEVVYFPSEDEAQRQGFSAAAR